MLPEQAGFRDSRLYLAGSASVQLQVSQRNPVAKQVEDGPLGRAPYPIPFKTNTGT